MYIMEPHVSKQQQKRTGEMSKCDSGGGGERQAWRVDDEPNSRGTVMAAVAVTGELPRVKLTRHVTSQVTGIKAREAGADKR